GSGLSQDQPPELVYLHGGRLDNHLRTARRWRRYWLDLLHSVQHDLFKLVCSCGWTWNLHKRILVDPDGAELHRHHSHDACAGYDVVSLAAVHLGTLRNQPGNDSRYAGDSNNDLVAGLRARFPRRYF